MDGKEGGIYNLYNFLRMVLPKLTMDLPRPFQMEGIIRKDDTMQHKAVRGGHEHDYPLRPHAKWNTEN